MHDSFKVCLEGCRPKQVCPLNPPAAGGDPAGGAPNWHDTQVFHLTPPPLPHPNRAFGTKTHPRACNMQAARGCASPGDPPSPPVPQFPRKSPAGSPKPAEPPRR
ncbi:hypothetical protein GCM10009631_14550 [Corynebacterium glaucum]